MNENETHKPGTRILLCGVQGCCPAVNFTENGVEFTDDFGGKVQLTPAQWNDLHQQVTSGALRQLPASA